MRIGIISQWYDPEVGSAGIPGSIARALCRLGHDVDVLTAFPNYPTGQVYDGYRIRPHQREEQGSITVHRVPVYPSHDARAASRIANFASFAASASLAAPRCLRHTDVALVYSTPATVGAAGMALRRFRGVPFVLLHPGLVAGHACWRPGCCQKRCDRPAWALTDAFCRSVYRKAFPHRGDRAHHACHAPGTRGARREARASSTTGSTRPCSRAVATRPHPSAGPARGLHVMYAGSLGDVQGLDVAVRAMALVPPEQNVTLRLVGSGVAEHSLRRLAADLGLA